MRTVAQLKLGKSVICSERDSVISWTWNRSDITQTIPGAVSDMFGTGFNN